MKNLLLTLCLCLTLAAFTGPVKADPYVPTPEQLEMVVGMYTAYGYCTDTPEYGTYVRFLDWYDCLIGCRTTGYAFGTNIHTVLLVCLDPDEGWLTLHQPALTEIGLNP